MGGGGGALHRPNSSQSSAIDYTDISLQSEIQYDLDAIDLTEKDKRSSVVRGLCRLPYAFFATCFVTESSTVIVAYCMVNQKCV